MNIFSIVEELEKVDPELNDRFNPRRAAIKNITSFGSKVALAALPFAIGNLFNRAYGAAPTQGVIDVLNFALKLEYLEAAFYNMGVSTGIAPSADAAAIATIASHENAHVAFLKGALGSSAVAQTSQGTAGIYDFTAGNTLPNYFVTKDWATFLTVANAFEDTGVRAYKGQAPNLMGSDYLQAALNIHSVEARHASHIRFMRRKLAGGNTPKSWITGNNDTGFPGVANNYAGEDLTVQATVDITKLTGATAGSTISVNAATEAFDEPLTMAQVVALVAPFGVK
ncbi:ferritin-like domain-containing protein [Mucilaginibacter paludis]|uniref:Dessication-associated protein n=1 Tax=Mucilaginibacter paludis DSM 18603 TaxID=714943 RepID=H1Y053_9SPHI|nr:ferritin-like domain-containing protein [Mucilaginibacter paludis]EHQ27962.1 hypothetical protein Mucpa_3870 [Mucilaginibacter paludis DSM 18603]